MFSLEDLPRMIDMTSIYADSQLRDIDRVCDIAKAYHCASTIAFPCYLSYTIKNTLGYDDVLNGSVTGFPFGGELTSAKVYEAKQLELMGAQEIDMVMNVGAFLSGNQKYAKQDMATVCESVKVPVKVIIETAFLDDKQIATAAELAVGAGAKFVKTSTGLHDKPTTVHMIKIIKDAIGDSALIKAAGGIRDVDTMLEMIDAGAHRFGLGVRSAQPILREIDTRLGRESLMDYIK
ncbi:MAG: deoxyribose-phosphate aldolase [Christensenella sp.]|uniref:deoxyribose-phosphate aldolase n=1 Tax=Christensenella sp. TaxID=1935934 RepID=UPI002B20E42C|nr:deoxyribose-phosphate aldolase [Christensenella sp.]MEA5003399.1 deoxyribose-phosphate aldolase [Christensenella sp.]